jgi:hypothetical protein
VARIAPGPDTCWHVWKPPCSNLEHLGRKGLEKEILYPAPRPKSAPSERRKPRCRTSTSEKDWASETPCLLPVAALRIEFIGTAPRSFVPSSRRKDGQIKHTAFDVTDEPAVRTLFEKAGPLDQLFLTVTPSSKSERASGLTMTG